MRGSLEFVAWKPVGVFFCSLLFWLPGAVLLFIPGWRWVGIVMLAFLFWTAATETIHVRATDREVCLRSLIGTTSYPLRDVKEIVFVDTTVVAGRLEFVDGKSVKIQGFMIERTDDLYKFLLDAHARIVALTNQT